MRADVEMKTLEFDAQVGADATLKVPETLAAQIDAGQPVHVVLLFAESGDETDWKRLAAEQFLNGYAPSDSIYDDVPAG